MKYTLRTACLLTVLVVSSMASAESESRWKLPKVNPKKKEGRASAPVWNNSNLPGLGLAEEKLSIAERLTSGPKRFVGKTRKWLTPWKTESNVGATFRLGNDTATALKSKRDRWRPLSWFRPKEPELPAPMTAHEFLGRKAPGFK